MVQRDSANSIGGTADTIRHGLATADTVYPNGSSMRAFYTTSPAAGVSTHHSSDRFRATRRLYIASGSSELKFPTVEFCVLGCTTQLSGLEILLDNFWLDNVQGVPHFFSLPTSPSYAFGHSHIARKPLDRQRGSLSIGHRCTVW